MPAHTDDPALTDDAVVLAVPAKPEHVAVLRAAAGAVASRIEFSLDDIDDLRILIDEAASVLLAAGAQDQLHCRIVSQGESVSFRLSAQLPDEHQPHGEGFAWSILKALAHEVNRETVDGAHVIAVTRRRGPVLDPTA